MSKFRKTVNWATRVIEVNRAMYYGICLGLGLLIAAVAWLSFNAADREKRTRERENAAAREARAGLHRRDLELERAIARISRLEHPTRAEIARQINIALRSLTPAQAQILAAKISQGAAVGSSGGGSGGTGTGGTGPGPRRSGGSSPGASPVPVPPDHPRPQPQPHGVVPPIDTPQIGPVGPMHICLPFICR